MVEAFINYLTWNVYGVVLCDFLNLIIANLEIILLSLYNQWRAGTVLVGSF